jgi:CheY-like chemotaxis protein
MKPPGGRLHGVHVLFVDDDPDTIEIMAAYLRYSGAFVRTARSGREALSALTATGAEVLIIDYTMPGMSGFELLEHIRKLPAENDQPTPAILYTAVGDLRDAAHAAGFSVYLTKPLDPRVLVDAVASLTTGGDTASSA